MSVLGVHHYMYPIEQPPEPPSAPAPVQVGQGLVGTLHKQPIGPPAPIVERKWRERFFVLKRGALAYYEVKQCDTFALSTTVSDVGSTPIALSGDGDMGYPFTVSSTRNDTIRLAALSRGRQDAFTEMVHDHAVGEGFVYYLEWEGTRSEQWVRRHYVHQQGRLVLRQVVLKGHFTLAGATLEQDEGGVLRLVKDTGTLTLRADAAWHRALSEALEQPEVAPDDAVDFYHIVRDTLASGQALMRTPQYASFTSFRERRPYLILSIDGGGMRGLIPCIVLERIVERFPDFLDRVSLVAGASNGALMAMGLAWRHHPHTMREMMELTARGIFAERQSRYTVSVAKYANRHLAMMCNEIWHDATMSDATTEVLVPSLALHADDSMGLEVFTEDSDERVADVVMKSCAAPTYFPAWKGSVDGGVFANNVSDLALAHAIGKEWSPSSIVLLSLSTGHVKQHVPCPGAADESTHNFGMYQWLKHLPAVLWYGMVEKSSLLCRTILGPERFHRVDPQLETDIPLDDPAMIPQISAYGKEVDLTDTFAWIEQHVYHKNVPP